MTRRRRQATSHDCHDFGTTDGVEEEESEEDGKEEEEEETSNHDFETTGGVEEDDKEEEGQAAMTLEPLKMVSPAEPV
jgi:hypothetical protein